MKRCTDVAGALTLLAVTSPILLAVAVLVKLSSPGGIFFRQERLGRHGRRFRLFKFRTMRADAETMLRADPELLARYVAGGHKIPDAEDPRITPVGGVLRRSGLDELPQLLNVLRGEMSLVGPRPIVPDEVCHYPAFPEIMRRTRPGLTGTWQVTRSQMGDYARREELDWEYVAKRSFGTDARILLRTIVRIAR